MFRQAFTLIELMVVVVILSFMLTLAVPTYKKYILKTRIEEAKATIQSLTFAQERYKQEVGEYFTPITLTYNEFYKNEENISTTLKVDLSKSANFLYTLYSESGGSFIIRAYIRRDKTVCIDGVEVTTLCKQSGVQNAQSWVGDNFDKDSGYVEFRYPDIFEDGDYIENGIDYKNILGI